jgi:hypothetical protein
MPQQTPQQDDLVKMLLNRMQPATEPTMGPYKRTPANTIYDIWNMIKDQPTIKVANAAKDLYDFNDEVPDVMGDAVGKLSSSFMDFLSPTLQAPELTTYGKKPFGELELKNFLRRKSQ